MTAEKPVDGPQEVQRPLTEEELKANFLKRTERLDEIIKEQEERPGITNV